MKRGHYSLVFFMVDAVSKANKLTSVLHLDLFHLPWSNGHAIYEEGCACLSIIHLHPLFKK